MSKIDDISIPFFFFEKLNKFMFKINDLIRFRYTGVQALIIGENDSGIYDVILLPEQEEAIAFEEDIVHEKAFNGIEPSPFDKKALPSTEAIFYADHYSPKKDKIQKQEISSYEKGSAKDKGLQLVLHEYKVDEFTMILSNDLPSSIGFQFSYLEGSNIIFTLKKIIPAQEFIILGSFEKSNLNHRLSYQIEFPSLNMKLEGQFKIQKIMSSKSFIPLLNFEATVYNLLDRLPLVVKKRTTDKRSGLNKALNLNAAHNSIESFANFPNEIDLHFEKLNFNEDQIKAYGKLKLQLNALENYISKAYQLGLNEAYVIHGIGQGILRKEVFKLLKKSPYIQSFNNDYFSRYGHGATKIFFK